MGKDTLKVRGSWKIEVFDKTGKLKHTETVNNLVTNEGKNLMLDAMFHGTAAIATWYTGLISLASYTGILVTDTMSSHGGWLEFTGYSESVRQTWVEGAAASQSTTNSSPMVFSVNASGTVKGIFLTSVNTKSGTTGVLWSSVLFAADLPVNSGDTINATYTCNLS